MEVVGVVFIATNHFLAVALVQSTRMARATAHQRLKSQRSAVMAISTATGAFNVWSDIRESSRRWSSCAPRRSARTLKCILPNPSPLGFSGFSTTRRSTSEARRSKLGPDGARFSFRQSAVLTYVLHNSCPRHTLVSRTVRRRGLDGPRTGEFLKKLLLSRIIYGIPDSRMKIHIDGLMHLRNNQLGKLVSP
jgi:hypothetical protein